MIRIPKTDFLQQHLFIGGGLDVSVICPVFNTSPGLIEAAVRSVLGQAGRHDLEVILVDDGSTRPETRAALRMIAESDGRVEVIFQDHNTGPSRARANGIAHASHDWIGFIDSDDIWPEDKLDRMRAVAEERSDARWIGGNYTTLLLNGERHPARRLAPTGGAGETAHRFSGPELTCLLVGSWLPLGVSLIRKDLIAMAGGFDRRLIYGEDWLLYLRLSTLAPLDYIESELYVLNRREASMMHSLGRLSAELSRSVRLARRDPSLRSARRELRWFGYGTYKDAAMNNALNGRKLRGLVFALRAFSVDPREIGDLLLFLRLLPATGPAQASGLREYSKSEQVVLARFFPGGDRASSDTRA